jgi:DDB1- and CUL4-associated factor 5
MIFHTRGVILTGSQHHYPTIYALSDPYPIAICTAERLPTGEPTPPTQRSYSNTCTTKHLSFGGPPSDLAPNGCASNDADQYLATGSDDFRGYVWKIPSTVSLLAAREEIENDDGDWDPPKGKFGYIMSALDQTLRVPVNLNQPAFRLGGHQSIVNTVRWHPVMPRIATCGIESKVVLHEYCESLSGSVKVESERVRRRTGSPLENRRRSLRRATAEARARALASVTGEASEEISEKEDSSTILYFDE